MTRSTLRHAIRTLAKATPAHTPVLTLLVSLRDGRLAAPDVYERHKRATLAGASRSTLPGLARAFDNAERFLQRDLRPESRGAAIIVRAGESPIRRHLQFRAELPTEISAGAWPSLLRLIELEERLGSFVLVRPHSDGFEVCESSLGDVETRQPWAPDAGRLADQEVAERTLQIVWNVARQTARVGGCDRVILAAGRDLAERVAAIDPRLDYSEPWTHLEATRPDSFESDFRQAVEHNQALRAEEAAAALSSLLRGSRADIVGIGPAEATAAVRRGDVSTVWLRTPAQGSALRPAAWQEDVVRWAARKAIRTRFAPTDGPTDARLRSLGGVLCVPVAPAWASAA